MVTVCLCAHPTRIIVDGKLSSMIQRLLLMCGLPLHSPQPSLLHSAHYKVCYAGGAGTEIWAMRGRWNRNLGYVGALEPKFGLCGGAGLSSVLASYSPGRALRWGRPTMGTVRTAPHCPAMYWSPPHCVLLAAVLVTLSSSSNCLLEPKDGIGPSPNVRRH